MRNRCGTFACRMHTLGKRAGEDGGQGNGLAGGERRTVHARRMVGRLPHAPVPVLPVRAACRFAEAIIV